MSSVRAFLERGDLAAAAAQEAAAAERDGYDVTAELIRRLEAERSGLQRENRRLAEALNRAARAFAQYALDTDTPPTEAVEGFVDGFKQDAALVTLPRKETKGPPPGYFVPVGDERCTFTMDACICMKRRGHDGLHACAHGGWRAREETR